MQNLPDMDANENQSDIDTNSTQSDVDTKMTQSDVNPNRTQSDEIKKEEELEITCPSRLHPRIPMNICEYFSQFDDLFRDLTVTYHDLRRRYHTFVKSFENLCNLDVDSLVSERYQYPRDSDNLFSLLLSKNINSLRTRECTIREDIINIQLMLKNCSRNRKALRKISAKGIAAGRAVRHKARRLLRVFDRDLLNIKWNIHQSSRKVHAFYEQKHFVLYNLCNYL